MRPFILTSALLVTVPYLGHAVPTTTLAASSGGDVVGKPVSMPGDKRELNLGGLLGPIGDILLNNPIGRVAQELIAEFFKLGDAGLNIPLDVLEKILQGKFGDAEYAAVEDVLKTLGGLPKDIARILGALGDPRHEDAVKH